VHGGATEQWSIQLSQSRCRHRHRHYKRRRTSKMLATLVNASPTAVQVFGLIAVIVFLVAGFIAYREKTVWATLICLGLAFVSAAVIFLA
jgi:hypothetical protein